MLTYNNIYYEIKNELSLTDKEIDILLSSKEIDESLQKVLKTIVDYKVNNNYDAKLSNEELYDLISETILKINDISDETKSKIINKASLYRNDISEYLYNTDISIIKGIL